MEIINRQLTNIEIYPKEINPDISKIKVLPPLHDSTRPIAPLVTAEYTLNKNEKCIYFRILVFIDSGNVSQPKFGVIDNETDYYVQYDFPDTPQTTSYSAWYFEATYTPTIDINRVTIYNNNASSRTSRGTTIIILERDSKVKILK